MTLANRTRVPLDRSVPLMNRLTSRQRAAVPVVLIIITPNVQVPQVLVREAIATLRQLREFYPAALVTVITLIASKRRILLNSYSY